jgi:uncharacterized membrane protein YedE/YeeE
MSLFANQCPWYLAGPLLGLLVIAMRAAGNLHLGALGSFVAAESWAGRPRALPGWRVFFLAGTVLGGLAFGLAAHDLHATFANGSFDRLWPALASAAGLGTAGGLAFKAVVLGGAGVMIGFGARTAGGCTSGHGVCGVAQGSPGSLASTATFVLTAVVVANLLGRMLARSA